MLTDCCGTSRLRRVAQSLALVVAWATAGAAWALDPTPGGVPLQQRWTLAQMLRGSANPAACTQAAPKLWRCDAPIVLSDKADLSIDGEGARIEFVDAARGKGGVRLLRARNLSLSHLEIGWSAVLATGAPLLSLGRVTACTSGQSGGVLQLDERYSGPSPLGSVSAWDDAKGWTWASGSPDRPDVRLPSDLVVSFRQGQSECLPPLAPQVGRRVLARLVMSTNHSLTCSDCQAVTIDGVRLTSGPGMGFVFDRNARDIVLRNNVIAPACSPRCAPAWPSISADGIHIAGAQGPFLIEGNDFGWQGDDSLNITGLLVAGQFESRSGKTARVRLDARAQGRLFIFRPQAPVTFYDAGLNVLGQGVVSAVDADGLTLDFSTAPPLSGEVILTADDRIPTQVIVRRNHFHDHRARGMLIGARQVLVEDNVIERVTMQGIVVPADTGIWMEGPGAQDVLIRRNTLANLNRYAGADAPSPISAGFSPNMHYTGLVGTPIQRIRVEDNTITDVIANPRQQVTLGRGVSQSRVGRD
jgi:hypothetical protein